MVLSSYMSSYTQETSLELLGEAVRSRRFVVLQLSYASFYLLLANLLPEKLGIINFDVRQVKQKLSHYSGVYLILTVQCSLITNKQRNKLVS